MKLWYRGVNAVYYLSREHLPALKRHLKLLQEYIITKEFNPSFCYPMNYMGELEETVGYVPGYWLLGSFSNLKCYCPDYLEKMIHLGVFMGDMPNEGLIRGANLMGSDHGDEDGFFEEQKRIEELNDKLNSSFPAFSVNEIREEFKSIRMRPNYNSLGKRAQLKQFFNLLEAK